MKQLSLSLKLVLIFCVLSAKAQSPRQYYHISNGWTDLNISGKIAGKFSWQLENQQRRQDQQGDYNPATTTGNPYHNLNQHVFRPYIHYQMSPAVRFSLMPLGWIGTNRFSNGEPSAFFSELRVSPQVILTQQLNRVRIDHRLRYEFRWLGANQAVEDKSFIYGGDFSTSTFRKRFRYQIKGSMPIGKAKMEDKTWYVQAYNELMINMGENVPNLNIFDQNRLLIGLGYRINTNLSVEMGYMQQSIFRFNNAVKNNVEINNILQVNLAISNFETFF